MSGHLKREGLVKNGVQAAFDGDGLLLLHSLVFCISHNFTYGSAANQRTRGRELCKWDMQLFMPMCCYYTCTWGAPDVHGFEVASFYDVNSDGVGSGVITQRQQQISTTSLQHTHTHTSLKRFERGFSGNNAIKVSLLLAQRYRKDYVCGAFPHIRFDCMDSDSRCHQCRVWGPSRTSSAVPAPLYSEEPRPLRSGRYGWTDRNPAPGDTAFAPAPSHTGTRDVRRDD